MKTLKKIFFWSVFVLFLIQFIQIDRTNKTVKKNENFVNIYKTPKAIHEILKNACYDCHSNETIYPEYASIAPISWSVKHHVNEGREHLNFSEWSTFNRDLKRNMLESAVADIKQQRMPIAGYIVYHPEAKLSAGEQKILIDYLESILKAENY